jgi:tRNA (guanine-N7-)-methyltransferase
MNPTDFIISRKRKKYKFAMFAEAPNCFEVADLSQEQTQYARGKKISLEVGAGTAFFSVALAKKHTDTFYIAMDVKADRLQKGAYDALTQKVYNIIFVRSHINELKEVIEPTSLDNIWLTFSDPFPKKRHAKHRLTHPNFLHQYAAYLKQNGSLYVKTDAPNLFTWSLEQLVCNHWLINELSFDLHNSTLSDNYKIQTSYEQRFVAEGLPIMLVHSIKP